jgi:hypothetical protein
LYSSLQVVSDQIKENEMAEHVARIGEVTDYKMSLNTCKAKIPSAISRLENYIETNCKQV